MYVLVLLCVVSVAVGLVPAPCAPDCNRYCEEDSVCDGLDLSHWDTSTVTDMTYMFYDNKNFNQNISEWDTSKVTDMEGVFYNANTFNQDLSNWDTGRVTSMVAMFQGTIFNQPIGNWNTSKVTNMAHMFHYSAKFFRDLDKWDTSKVQDMTLMFAGAVEFNGEIISWDVSSVTNMNGMFYGAKKFSKDISRWNVSKVTNMDNMFGDTEYRLSLYSWCPNITTRPEGFTADIYSPSAEPRWGACNTTSQNLYWIIGVAVPVVLTSTIVLFCVVRKRNKQVSTTSSTIYGNIEIEKHAYDLQNIETMTLDSKDVIDFKEITLIKRLGSGAFGIVHLASYDEEKVAVKECMPNANMQILEEFKKEASLMLNIKKHPAIVSILGVCFNKETMHMVMEYCDGGSLDTLRVDLEQKIKILGSVANGLHHLHRNGVVHRDISARNILLSKRADNTYQPKISDFGMSRLLDAKEQNTTQSNLGPIKWMAPENIKDKVYSTASDVWSFGILVYEVLAAKIPHEEEDMITIAVKIRDFGITPELPIETPDWLMSLCKRCWQYRAEDRITMRQVCEEFKGHT